MTKTNPFCDVCGKEFLRNGGLERHKANKKPCKPPRNHVKVAEKPEAANAEAAKAQPQVIVEDSEFREASKKFNESLTREQRSEQGIFFTPKKARDILFAALEPLNLSPKKILEPSFGTGEFILDAKKKYPSAEIIGVEKNPELFNSFIGAGTDGTYHCCDFLNWKGEADLIIGNPPYFIMDKDTKAPAAQAKAMTGRPNIYVMFLYKCLEEHMSDGAHLAFIIPTSLYNCVYYQPMRDYIHKHTTIVHLENLTKPGFFETGQETMLIVLEKKKRNDDYFYQAMNGKLYISPFYTELKTVAEGATTMDKLGLATKTGNVVWNQVKDKLSDTPGTLLVYSSNINNCELKIGNLNGKERKQYVKDLDKPLLSGPVILVERGYGNSFSFNFALTTLKYFYAENHINVIYAKDEKDVSHLERVVRSFQLEKTKNFVKWFVGSGSISGKDLESMFPIF
jgi:hypothetical protein